MTWGYGVISPGTTVSPPFTTGLSALTHTMQGKGTTKDIQILPIHVEVLVLKVSTAFKRNCAGLFFVCKPARF